MMRRYGMLFVVTLLAGGLAAFAGRRPQAVVPGPSGPAAPAHRMTVEIVAAGIAASATTIPVGTPVELEVVNRTALPARLRLAGYEDRVDSGSISAGGVYRVAFLADRPGERFAWIVGEEPRGRLDVTGSHLVEGHR